MSTSPAETSSKTRTYADSIADITLDTCASIRKRPGMYAGDATTVRALLHLLSECVGNAIDEHLAGHCQWIRVTVHADDSFTVEDDGRGISVEPSGDGRSLLERALTLLHTSPTLDGHSPHVHLSTHGIGLVAVNALSERLEVSVRREGKLFRQRYSRGKPVTPLCCEGAAEGTGTTLHFRPDPDIYGELRADHDLVRGHLRTIAACCPGLDLRFIDERQALRCPSGMSDLLPPVHPSCQPLPAQALEARSERDGVKVDLALRWVKRSAADIVCLMNMQRCEGTPLEGLLSGIHASFTRLIQALKSEGQLAEGAAPEALSRGLEGRLSIFHPDPSFAGPRKLEVSSPELVPLVEELVRERLDRYVAEQPEEARRVVQRACGLAPPAAGR